MFDRWIAYVGPFQFPWGQPGSRRVYGIARTIADAGFNVVVGCGEASPVEPVVLDEGKTQGSISYLGLRELPSVDAGLLAKSFQLFVHWGKKTVAWLDAQPVKPTHVVVYGGSAQYMYHLRPWCRRNKIPLIVDVVEWYDASHMKGGFFGPFHLSAKYALKAQYPQCDGVIAISSYLANYFRARGKTVTLVPPTLNMRKDKVGIPAVHPASSTLTLVYAGSPGKKDLLTNVIQGISLIDPHGERVRLLVIGPDTEQVCHLLHCKKAPRFVEVMGRVAQTEVAKILRSADFSVLLREPLRFAQAGFPTKFVESLASGIPVIANITSDLGFYLHDGVEGLICPDHTVKGFADTLERAMRLQGDELQQMRLAAQRQAERSFDYRNYTESMSEFLQQVRI